MTREGSYIPRASDAATVDAAVLRPRVAGNQQLLQVGTDVLRTNDPLVEPLQRYPGESLGKVDGRDRFPVPDQVGAYCDREAFLAAPKFMAQWVHWPKRAELVLEGRYHELPPAHFEGIFTLVCNFMCPHCSRRVTRKKWVEGGTWDHNTPIEKRNTMHPDALKRVLDEIASLRTDDQMGIVWGGGDPTANPFTYDAMLYAYERGISASFLTNGVFLEVDRTLDADPILIRISLNCGTEDAYRRFHGYPRGWDYFDRVREKMRELARRKLERRARTLIGISLIVDERNMDDLVAAAEEIRSVVEDAGPGIDYVIVRPVMNYSHFDSEWAKLADDTKQRAVQLIEPGGAVWRIVVDELGIPLVPIKDSFDEPPPAEFYDDGSCLAYGMAGEIRHNGDVQLCSDSYGNPDYTVGNLFESSLTEIWTSDRRREVLDRTNSRRCFATTCPHNSRGHHYNRLFHQIEGFRREARMDEVHRWVADLREATLPLRHSFFL
jgi:MoaA/NifB/PqqE/SkfB family radical SAM enzyme